MSLSRAFGPGEEVRRCRCGHVIVAKATDVCPRCTSPLEVVRDQQATLVRLADTKHLGHLSRAFGVRGKLRVGRGRVLGVLKGGRA